ncbi:hypothetical protein RJ639_013137 [Escallonia herrerae]|uniref:BAH domain-containing protein n=1 Tax=Escallonia herrerae TaxID=1293975 RepID=A0AA89ANF3_9ASTE|nr:hypothetical protein RJ639_013137 [Escallonia herrerae]
MLLVVRCVGERGSALDLPLFCDDVREFSLRILIDYGMPCMEQAGEVENLFKWGKKRGVGGKKKEVQFYESFSYDGEEYALYDCVYMHNESEPKPFIGKLVKIWETADKTRKVKVQWFFRPLEISNWLRDVMTLENEIFLAHGQGVGLANVNPLVI